MDYGEVMKMIMTLLAVFILSASFAAAQDVNGFSSKAGFNAPGVAAPGSSKPNPNVILKPKLGGVITDGVKYGPMIISPAAPASWGIGQKYLSAPSPRADLQNESCQAAHRDSGGFKLFSLEF